MCRDVSQLLHSEMPNHKVGSAHSYIFKKDIILQIRDVAYRSTDKNRIMGVLGTPGRNEVTVPTAHVNYLSGHTAHVYYPLVNTAHVYILHMYILYILHMYILYTRHVPIAYVYCPSVLTAYMIYIPLSTPLSICIYCTFVLLIRTYLAILSTRTYSTCVLLIPSTIL